jgi:hypothetical protein
MNIIVGLIFVYALYTGSKTDQKETVTPTTGMAACTQMCEGNAVFYKSTKEQCQCPVLGD